MPIKVYDETIRVVESAVQRSKLDAGERTTALKRPRTARPARPLPGPK